MPDRTLYNENELLLQIADGDEAAFTELYEYYRDRIYYIALKLSSSNEVAEDMVQEIFLKIWLKRSDLLHVSHFRAYLFTISRNHIVRYLKGWARTTTTAQRAMIQEERKPQGADTLLLEKEYDTLFREAVSRLSPQQATVYQLSKEQGMKREDIALQLGLSPETVKAHLAQAVKNIRAYCLARLDLLLLLWFLKK